MNLSNIVNIISTKFPNAFNKKVVENLVINDKISFESAANLVANIDARHANEGSRSSESNNSAVSKLNEDSVTDKAVDNFFKEVKLSAMVEGVKKDDTLLYTEYLNLTNARERVLSEIVKKEEGNFDQLLNELKTTGADASVIDKLLNTKVDMTDYEITRYNI